MLRTIALLSLIAFGAALKKGPKDWSTEAEIKSINAEGGGNWSIDADGTPITSGDGDAEAQGGSAHGLVIHDLDESQGEVASNSRDSPIKSATITTNAAVSVDSGTHDLDGSLGDVAQNQAMPAISRGIARSQQYSDAQNSSAKTAVSSNRMFWLLCLMLIAGGGAAGFAVLNPKGAKEMENISMVSSVSLGVRPRAAPAPLPEGITEVDVLETFDSYDKPRAGFIEKDIIDGLIGPDADAQSQVQKTIGQVDKLFYHDFRKLVLQSGPVQNAVANTASRKRGRALELTAMAH